MEEKIVRKKFSHFNGEDQQWDVVSDFAKFLFSFQCSLSNFFSLFSNMGGNSTITTDTL